MAKTYKETMDIFRNTYEKILSNTNEFLKFIKFYSNIYKYDFQSAVTIYGQNENVKALASYEDWQKINYQVRKGSKGISIFDEKAFSKLKYIFDVSSTYQKDINLWQFREEHKSLITKEENMNIEQYFLENRLDYIENINYNYINTDELKECLFDVNYIAKCNRLGIETKGRDINKSLSKINEINECTQQQILKQIFKSIEMDLREIEKNIIGYERSKKYEYSEERPNQRGIRQTTRGNEQRNETTRSGDVWEDGNGIYERNERRMVQYARDTTETTTNIQYGDGGEDTKPNRPTDGNETYERANTEGVEYTRGNSSQENDTQRSDGSGERRDDIHRPFSRDRWGISDENRGTQIQLENIKDNEKTNEKGQEKLVPFLVPKNTERIEEIKNQENIIEEIKENTKENTKEKKEIVSNFSLDEKISYPKTTMEKIAANISAIKLLKQLEDDDRNATREEQQTLSSYVGWGGLPQMFEAEDRIKSPLILAKSKELKFILTEKEYKSAKSSVLNAHYTDNEIIKQMYNAVDGFGLKGNIKILEPSCGTGNFIGNIPQNWSTNITGIELDSITGRIAKKLYPNTKIKINGFEQEQINNNSIDLIVGNVPFGDYKIFDSKYKNAYLIHDYFINKSIDLAKPNGIVAVITSSGTLDKKSINFREEISKKAELVGAIRLPNTAFKNAGTEVTADILFFQKLEKEREEIPNWVYTTDKKYETRINNYFEENKHMIAGDIGYKTNRFGRYDLVVTPTNAEDTLGEQLEEITKYLPKNILDKELLQLKNEEQKEEIDLNNIKIKPFRYAIVGEDIYYNDTEKVEKSDVKKGEKERLKAIIQVRDLSRELIDIQIQNRDDFEPTLKKFNETYDKFVVKYGYLSEPKNIAIFKEDDDVHFLTSLELKKENGYDKATFFYKKTVAHKTEITEVDNAKDGLILSINKSANIDFDYIKSIYKGKETKEIIDELVKEDLIYLNPLKYKKEDISKGWEVKCVYIDGNVKEKLKIANTFKEESPYFQRNIKALEEVLPKNLSFADLSINMGSDLYKPEDIKKFAKELLKLGYTEMKVHYDKSSAEWRIYNKADYGFLATEEYGTKRISALNILEKMLNNQPIVIKDEKEDEKGKKIRVMNKEETINANGKKDMIALAFDDFVFKNEKIRNRVAKEYNERFNTNINSSFDIEMEFEGLNPEIKLRLHQKNAVTRSILSSENLLLDHVVGAGKTFVMIVSAMEKKRLRLVNKSLLVVPNNIVGQFKNDFYKLYPNANILFADEKSFNKENRKKFLSKISQNDYDAIIMGHSQFDLLKVSPERQKESIQEEIFKIEDQLMELDSKEDRLTVKNLERTKKSMQTRLEKLNAGNTETILDFEELGVDSIYLDEAHKYKNLYFNTALKVSGLNQTNSQKASNLKMKMEYLDEIGGKVVFATGTPISNTMAELYTMQRYLTPHRLDEMGVAHFDAWQKIFAKAETKLEIAPSGTGFEMKTRLSKFKNTPELMVMYKSFADVITADMLDYLPIPKAEVITITAPTNDYIKREMNSFVIRSENCKNGLDPSIDNILKIIHDGRYLALDIRHIDEDYPNFSDSKVNLLVENVLKEYKNGNEKGLTQSIFSDISTPKKHKFNVYDDIKNKLIEKGVNENEIEFIHNAKSLKEKEEISRKVRTGEIRVVLGSTEKMGAGTNFQDKLIAQHHLDVPLRPSDLEQRDGRIVRQGNTNMDGVRVYRYVTEGSFDAFMWQILENKQRFISQFKTGAVTGREVDDIDEVTLNFAEIKAIAIGNPQIKRMMEIDNEIGRLTILEKSFKIGKLKNEEYLRDEYPQSVEKIETKISGFKEDIKYRDSLKYDEISVVLGGNTYTDKEKAGEYLLLLARNKKDDGKMLGSYKGFEIHPVNTEDNKIMLKREEAKYYLKLNSGYKGANIDLLDKRLNEIELDIENSQNQLEKINKTKEQIEISLKQDFAQKEELINLYKEKRDIEMEFEKENINKENTEVEEVEEDNYDLER